MARLYVHHKVEDYAQWRKVFDDMTDLRTSFGMTGEQVFQVASDPKEIVIITDWPTVEKARAYAQSPDLKQGMQRAGVVSQPEILFLEEA
jgi:hypothetical protein